MSWKLMAVLALGALAAPPAWAQSAKPSPSPTPEPDELIRREEVVVVSASKAETALINAPATMTVVTQHALESSPAQNYGDLLRSVPGLNVIQTSARDISMTSRQNTSTLANTQLVLLDGRSIYLDFFGLVLWDFVPVNASEIRQIEVIRGPASAVWGANALTGVVNIITKTPRESEGTNVTLSGGAFSRDAGTTAGQGLGSSFGVNATVTRVPSDRWAYKVSAGHYRSDDLPRPTGRVPPGRHPLDAGVVTGGGEYPGFENQGTNQPKFDLRVDQEISGGRITYGAGVAGTDGIIHTATGPFDIQTGSRLAYGKVSYSRGGFKLNAFTNVLDGAARNLLAADATGAPVKLDFETQTYDVEVGHNRIVGRRHILTYGGNVRRNEFDISVAQAAEPRTELGAYFQDEIFTDRFRVVLGARLDHSSALGGVLFSPRVTGMYKPHPDHAVRASVNRAFRSPTVIDNALELSSVVGFFPLGMVDPRLGSAVFPLVARSVGNPDLDAESLTAYEIAYTGTFGGGTTVGVAVYLNDRDDNITVGDPALYSSANPPPGWPLPPMVLDLLAQQGIAFPAVFTFENRGVLRNRGVEVSLEHSFSRSLSGFANYSWQGEPEARGGNKPFPPSFASVPPAHRINAGMSFSRDRLVGSLSVNYVDDAFWADVLGPPFAGPSEGYTMVNASVGLRWAGGKVTTFLKGTNLTDASIQQHNFGDILKRSVVAEVRLAF